MQPADRNRDLAAIHVMAAQLGMNTSDKHPASEYRSMLYAVGGPTAKGEDGNISSGNLEHVGRQRVRAHLAALCKARGIKAKQPPIARAGRPTPAQDRVPMVRKIRAMLAEAGRGDEYADGLARRMYHVERYEWLQPEQMRRVVAALCYDRGRRRMRGARETEAKHNMPFAPEV